MAFFMSLIKSIKIFDIVLPTVCILGIQPKTPAKNKE